MRYIKNKKYSKILIVLLIVIGISSSFLMFKSYGYQDKELPKVRLKNETKKKTFAIMLEDNYQGGNYTEYESDEFPTDGYTFNSEKSKCVDNNGNIVKDVLSYDYENKLIKLDTSKTVYCYIYYDRTMFLGDGTEKNPYQIKYIEDLVRLSNSVNSGDSYSGKYFELTKSLDFKEKDSYENSERTDFGNINGVSETETLINELTNPEGSGFAPIGNYTIHFKGNFNGNNNKINNLFMNNLNELHEYGFFRFIEGNTIENLSIDGTIYSKTKSNIGSIGRAQNSTLINYHNSIDITVDSSTYSTGGLIGAVDGETLILNSSNDGNVTGGTYIGGLIGDLATGNLKISNSHNSGKVEKENDTSNNAGMGGLVGYSTNQNNENKLIIESSYNEGDIIDNPSESRSTFNGGLIGRNCTNTDIIDSYNTGNIIKNNDTDYATDASVCLGGLIGNIVLGNIKIIDSYNAGQILKGNRMGGLIGQVNSGNTINTVIDRSYNKGLIDAQGFKLESITVSGGIVGISYQDSNVHILNSYNSGNINGISYTSGIFGISYGITSITNSFNVGNITSDIHCYGIIYSDKGNLKIDNVYNLGNVTGGTSKYGIGWFANVELSMQNAYYKSNNISGSNYPDLVTVKNDTEIKNNEFVNLLNTNLDNINLIDINDNLKNYSLNKWTLGVDNYPILINDYDTKYTGKSLIANKPLNLTDDMPGDLYRYQGDYKKVNNNYICFGTEDRTKCLNNPDKYMYRIIGITSMGNLKILKKEALNNTSVYNNNKDIEIVWVNSDLFKKLNGLATNKEENLFIDNNYYDYTNNDSKWLKKIKNYNWYYGKIPSNSTGAYQNGLGLYDAETKLSHSEEKIGILNLSDYYLSYDNVRNWRLSADMTNWMFINNNDLNNQNKNEWLIDNIGYLESYNGYLSWVIHIDGELWTYINNTKNIVRPVFYLEDNVEFSGIGSLNYPYVITN